LGLAHPRQTLVALSLRSVRQAQRCCPGYLPRKKPPAPHLGHASEAAYSLDVLFRPAGMSLGEASHRHATIPQNCLEGGVVSRPVPAGYFLLWPNGTVEDVCEYLPSFSPLSVTSVSWHYFSPQTVGLMLRM
jgi:hypothetical protein